MIRNLASPKIVCHADAAAFLNRCRSSDLYGAAINHNIAQIATILNSGEYTYKPPFWFCTVEVKSNVIGAAIYAIPDGLVISDMPSAALRTLLDKFSAEFPSPIRVIGEPEAAKFIATYMESSTGTLLLQSTGWFVGKLDCLNTPRLHAPGVLRVATESDLDLVTQWGRDYGKEKPAFVDIPEFMTSKLNSGELYIWEDEVPTTIITVSGRTESGVRISSVYTPPRHRGFGYASSTVAKMCENLLRSGHRYIVITWRIGDPIGKMYQRLGFRIIGSQQSYIECDKKTA